MPVWASVLVGVGLLCFAGFIDVVTGPDVASAVFYVPAIVWMAMSWGRWPGLCAALASGIIWLAAVLTAHRQFESPLIPYWNALVRTTMFSLVAGLSSELLERKRAEKNLQQAYEDLQKLGRQVAEASDREQRRLGEDLHDGLCQHLVSTAFAARGLVAKLAERSLPEAQDASEIAELLGESIAQARDVARGLYLVPLEAGGLRLGARRIRRRTCVHATRSPASSSRRPPSRSLEETVVTNLFRIAQEAVNNAIKHAQARPDRGDPLGRPGADAARPSRMMERVFHRPRSHSRPGLAPHELPRSHDRGGAHTSRLVPAAARKSSASSGARI